MISRSPSTTRFSLVVPLPPDGNAERSPLLASLRAQSSVMWEAVFVGNGEVQRHVGGMEIGPEVSSTSAALDSLALALEIGLAEARGDLVGFLDAESSLPPGALDAIAAAVDSNPETDVLYTDESDLEGSSPVRKPVYSPEWLRGQNYLGNLTLYSRALLDRIGGFSNDVPGAEVYDLALRATAAARSVLRIPIIFCHTSALANEIWPVDREVALGSIRLALERHLESTGGGVVEAVRASGIHDTRRLVSGEPLVSIIIPTRGDVAVVNGTPRCLVVEAVRSVLARTTYSNYEIVVVIDDVATPKVAAELLALAGDRVRFVPWSRPFSFSDKMNLGVLHSRGEYLLFLNDDVEVISPGWMNALLALGQRPKSGLVGAMLYFEDDTIQHAGHAYYRLDVTHIGLNSERGSAGPNGAFLVEREVDGATAACALLRREAFFEAGGFSSLLPGNFNDVDLSMKLAKCGYQSYISPHAELYHFESKSRDPRVSTYELDTTWKRWEHLFYDSPHWPEDPHQLYRRVPGT